MSNIKTSIETAAFGQLGVITLDKPKALNALSLTMIEHIQQALDQWLSDDKVKAVWIQGSGDKAFCAGGDVVALYNSIKQSKGKAQHAIDFFTQEYHLDQTIHQYPKPIIVWGDGIVMGGGIGLMVGASHRIVTERSMIAMPEVTIGLYPDVGASWFFNRMPGKCGEFLGMTGARMNAADAIFVKLADYAVNSDGYNDLQQAILNSDGTHQGISQAIQSTAMATPLQQSKLWQNFELINQLMQALTLSELINGVKALKTDDKWLQMAQKTMLNGSMLSIALVREQIKRAKHKSLSQVFTMEHHMSIRSTTNPDLAEGIRALLIDKDGQPNWQIKSPEQINQQLIQSFFQPPQETQQ